MVSQKDRKGSISSSASARFLNVLAFAAMLASLALCGPAEAHHPRNSADKTSGLSIPNLTHGQLHIISRYESEIMNLANHQFRPSLEARTLQNYVNLQLAYCFWGLMPGSISNEASPFNECSHAYLAATKVLLEKLEQDEGTRARAASLTDQINLAMLEDVTALEMCSNSFEPFNTAQIIMPTWGDVPINPLGVLLGFFIFGASAAGLAMARGSSKTVQSVGN